MSTDLPPLRKLGRLGKALAGRLPHGPARLPRHLFGYVLETSAVHQLVLLVLTVAVFLIELVPLELQRRIVNDLAKHREFQLVITLCLVYAGVAAVHGGAKLVLNVYRSWVGECATRDLRRRIRSLVEDWPATPEAPELKGTEVAMIVAEVEPIGGFVGGSVSEPVLQCGVLLSVLAYMLHLELWVAVATLAIFLPQLVIVALMQRAINRRTAKRIGILRELGTSIIAATDRDGKRGKSDDRRIERVFELNMGVFRLKFSMNFIMNLCNHLQVVTVLLVGGWYVLQGQLEIGGVVAFISAIGRLNDPWGDLVNYFRDLSSNQVKYEMLTGIMDQLAKNQPRKVTSRPSAT
ncbi:MAG: transporter ATP-binding protein [Rhodospirillales bacterium]|nr:transporter ATP-binding protein [Rhodospirillales bacterium]